MAAAIPWVVGALSAYSAYASYESAQETKAAARAQQRSIEVQQKQADEQSFRQRVAAVREARLRRSSVEAQSAATGTMTSSGYAGAVASVQSQLGSNLSFLDTQQSLSRQASIFNIQAAGHQGNAAELGALSKVSGSFASMMSGGRSIFDPDAWK